jgi:hypothetical protein
MDNSVVQNTYEIRIRINCMAIDADYVIIHRYLYKLSRELIETLWMIEVPGTLASRSLSATIADNR